MGKPHKPKKTTPSVSAAPTAHAQRQAVPQKPQYTQSYELTPYDTWFFRESRPHAAVGGHLLKSLFPPPARALRGMLGQLQGQQLAVDWARFRDFKSKDESSEGNDYGNQSEGELNIHRAVHEAHGRLRLRDLSLALGSTRLYPMPSALLAAVPPSANALPAWSRLSPSQHALITDIGYVRIPQAVGDVSKGSHQSDWLVNTELLEQFLANQTITAPCLPPDKPDNAPWAIPQSELVTEEARLGIAVQASNRLVRDGALFQTLHLRPVLERPWRYVFKASVNNFDSSPHKPLPMPGAAITTIGGEGRPAVLAVTPKLPRQPVMLNIQKHNGLHHLLIYFATAADFSHFERFGARQTPAPDSMAMAGAATADGNEADNWNRSGQELRGLPRTWSDTPAPAAAMQATQPTARTWRINLCDQQLELVCVASPRPQREGGWALSQGRPEPMRSLVAAGTCWFCTTPSAQAAQALHGKLCGEDTALGRGQIFVGTWSPRGS